MENMWTCVLMIVPLLTVVIWSPLAHGFNTTDAGNLEDFLKTGYYKTIRPEDQTHVGVSYGLLHISSLDIVTQQINVIGFIVLSWTDSRLQWNPLSYGNITYTNMLQSDIWVPPIVLNNAADGLKILKDDSDTASTFAAVVSNGQVTIVVPANLNSQCIVNIKYYPFDSQECHMILTPWGYSYEELNLYTSVTAAVLDLYEENGEWDIIESQVTNHSRPVAGTSLSSAKITLSLQRKYSYYLINLILPIILLAILGAFVFILPVESGEKNGFSLTILLSMSVVMTLVSDHIPPIATQTCQLSVYLLVVFIICSLETGLTVISCQIHAYTAKGYVPGKKLQKLARFVAKVSCFRRHKEASKDDHDNIDDTDAIKMKTNEANRTGNGLNTPRAWDNEMKNEIPLELHYTYEEIAFLFDRFNFITFFVLTVLYTMVFFIALSVGGTA